MVLFTVTPSASASTDPRPDPCLLADLISYLLPLPLIHAYLLAMSRIVFNSGHNYASAAASASLHQPPSTYDRPLRARSPPPRPSSPNRRTMWEVAASSVARPPPPTSAGRPHRDGGGGGRGGSGVAAFSHGAEAIAPRPHPSVAEYLAAAAAQLGQRPVSRSSGGVRSGGGGGGSGLHGGLGAFGGSGSGGGHHGGVGAFGGGDKHGVGAFGSSGGARHEAARQNVIYTAEGRIDPRSYVDAPRALHRASLKEFKGASPHATLPIARGLRSSGGHTTARRLDSYPAEPPAAECPRCSPTHRH